MDVKKFNFYTNNINVITAKARFEYLDEKKKAGPVTQEPQSPHQPESVT